MLLNEEFRVIEGFGELAPKLETLSKTLAERIAQGGRIIFVGVGSSGRVGVDLAAKAISLCPELKCFGVIGGGDGALIQAKEGFEDSPEQGEKAAANLNLTAQDSVFLISASGSASFNAGFGHAAANEMANVYFFYNSEEVPERTNALFERFNNPVTPLLIDIGPQAILGSTRLQGYSIARVCLGYLLEQTICCYKSESEEVGLSVDVLSQKLKVALKNIESVFPDLIKIVNEQQSIFSSFKANFRRIRDETKEGYVTFLGDKKAAREAIIDNVETSPTFFLNPRRKEQDCQKRKAEYQAYLVGESDNNTAWQNVLGRAPYSEEDGEETSQFILGEKTPGNESFMNRPTGPGNLVIGAAILKKDQTLSESLIESLQEVKANGGKTALIVISEDLQPKDKEELLKVSDHIAWVDGIEDDSLELTSSQTLKWTLNLLSNGSMILMGKVLGNRMIDVRTSNNKLIDRCMRLVNEIWKKFRPGNELNQKELYELLLSIYDKQKSCQEQGEYTPSTLKIVLAMLEKKCSFEDAVFELGQNQESIDSLFKLN